MKVELYNYAAQLSRRRFLKGATALGAAAAIPAGFVPRMASAQDNLRAQILAIPGVGAGSDEVLAMQRKRRESVSGVGVPRVELATPSELLLRALVVAVAEQDLAERRVNRRDRPIRVALPLRERIAQDAAGLVQVTHLARRGRDREDLTTMWTVGV